MSRWRPVLGRDAASGVVLVAVALVAWLAAGDLPFGTLHRPGPGFLPRSLAVLIGALALLLVARGARGEPERGSWPDRSGARRVAVMLLALLAYAALLEPAGYVLATAALFVVLLRWVSAQSWIVTTLGTVLASGGSYVLFARWLMVSLPTGLWAP
jgi:putative tricarboxylic transport membrane protein